MFDINVNLRFYIFRITFIKDLIDVSKFFLNLDCPELCVNVTSEGGYVRSPSFPYDYDGSSDCVTTIKVITVGAKVKIDFTTFFVEEDYDDLKVILIAL